MSIFCLIFLNYDQNYKIFIFFIIFYTITTDVFSFFTGKLLGGPKLAPLISPGKTISGSLGGILLPTVLSLILFSKNGSSLFLIGFTSVLFSVIVQLGDLIESYFRKCLVKESSNLIPGHGGVLDRFDGFILLIVCVYILKFSILILLYNMKLIGMKKSNNFWVNWFNRFINTRYYKPTQ